MSHKAYRVNRQVHDQHGFFRDYPEYAGYRMYMVESGSASWNTPQSMCILTREMLMHGQSVSIDEDKEFLPLREGTSAHTYVSGTRAVCYRPARMLSNTFTIKSMVLSPQNPIEFFGNRRVAHQDYYCYEIEQTTYGGYRGSLARLFTKALHFRGMEISMDEITRLPERKRNDIPHFMHETDSNSYKTRLIKTLRA